MWDAGVSMATGLEHDLSLRLTFQVSISNLWIKCSIEGSTVNLLTFFVYQEQFFLGIKESPITPQIFCPSFVDYLINSNLPLFAAH